MCRIDERTLYKEGNFFSGGVKDADYTLSDYSGESLRVTGDTTERGIYRGWMLKPEDYARLYVELERRGLTLITTPECYSRFHLFPKIYEWLHVFYKYRGSLYTSGLCIKEYLDLKSYDKKSNEYRVFYINGGVGTVSRNSLQPLYTPELPKGLVEKYKNLKSPFYTLDFAELVDGSWKIIEAGDGQSAGLRTGKVQWRFIVRFGRLLTIDKLGHAN